MPAAVAASVAAAALPEGSWGTCTAFLDAAGTQSRWLSLLCLDQEYVCVLAFTFDLDAVAQGLIGVVRRREAVHVLVDAQHTRDTPTQQAVLADMAREQVRVKLGWGRPLLGAYLRANPTGALAGRTGHLHAKVLLTPSHMIVGSTNFSTGSQANEEVAVEILLSPQGARRARQHFQNLWDRAQVFEPGRDVGRTRSPSTRIRGRSSHQ